MTVLEYLIRARIRRARLIPIALAATSVVGIALAGAIDDEHGVLKDPRRNLVLAIVDMDITENGVKGNFLPREHSTTSFPFQLGWPVTVSGAIEPNPAVADIDGDGDLEVVFSAVGGLVHALQHDGTPVGGWPQSGGAFPSASLVDIETDGTLEIFIGSGKSMKAFFHDGVLLPGWPRETAGLVFHAAAAIDDLDGNGEVEIVAGTNYGPMHVWEETGMNHPGWPQDLSTPVSPVVAGAALGELSGCGTLEVVVGSQDRMLYGWDHMGRVLSSFPRFIGARLNGEAALADVDKDGETEIIIGTDFSDTDGLGRVYVLNPDGSPVPGWPQVVGSNINGGIAVGDIDDDGALEVVVGTTNFGWGDFQGRVWAWNAEDGSLLPGWPQATTSPSFSAINSSPALGDLNGDRRPDILAVGLVGLGATGVWAWNADGTRVDGFPFIISGFANVVSSPTITDLDGDGDVEIGFGTEHPASVFLPAKMFFFDLPAQYDPSTMEWPTLSHDVQRTGRYSRPPKRRIPLDAVFLQPFLDLDQPSAVLVAKLSFPEDPTGPFAVTAVDGVPIEPIPESEPAVSPPGRLGWSLARFDGADLAQAILLVRPDADEVVLTLHALKGVRAELVGETRLEVK